MTQLPTGSPSTLPLYTSKVNTNLRSEWVQCGAVSYKTCAEFATAFDEIYQHRDTDIYPQGNPMLRDPNVELNATMSSNDILGQLKFPTAAVLHQDASSGIKTFHNYSIRDFDNFPGEVELNEGYWKYASGDVFNYPYSGEVPLRAKMTKLRSAQQLTYVTASIYIVDLGCTASRNEGNTSSVAMQACDASINTLAGRSTSIGALKAMAKELKDSNGTKGMPGHCCLDSALNSEHFGNDVSSLE